jgi:endonuclease-3 related protein
MPGLVESFPALLDALVARYGERSTELGASDPFEALIAIVLGHAPESPRAGAALAALRDADLLDPSALAQADAGELAVLLSEAGVASSTKAGAVLQRVARWVVAQFGGSAESLRGQESAVSESVRDSLVALNGIGPATADAILLFALGRPSYPVDRATYRVLVRHGWLDPGAGYDEARETVVAVSPNDARPLTNLARGMEALGRDYCRARIAKCEGCPLEGFLPEGGPRGD